MRFNHVSRQTRDGMRKDKITPLLNGFDYKAWPHDGIARFAYTGKGWVCWRDGVLLGTGWADIDPNWFNGICNFLNAESKIEFKGSPFVYLGFGSPTFGSHKFYQWLVNEGRERGFKQSYGKLDVLEAFEIIKAI